MDSITINRLHGQRHDYEVFLFFLKEISRLISKYIVKIFNISIVKGSQSEKKNREDKKFVLFLSGKYFILITISYILTSVSLSVF